MPFGSLRAKLLIWYAAALLAVTAAFGSLLYLDFRRSLYDEVDGRLSRQAAALAGSIQPESERSFYVELTAEQVTYFDQDGEGAPYYAIWDRAGQLVDQSHPGLAIPFPAAPGAWRRGDGREHALRGPAGSLVLVGQGTSEESRRLARLLAIILAVGSVVLVLTLAAGWFLTGRALAPIHRISEAAATISASNLAARIDVAEMETELGELATTINATFDRLEHAFDQQTQFTADASHELRTPLSIVLAQADLTLKRVRTVPEYCDALETIRRSARRMKSVVEGLLVLARADTGALALVKEEMDLAPAVEDACRLLAPLAAERNLKLETRLEPLSAWVDRERFAELMANLVGNAIRYNRDGGRIEVRLRRQNGDAILEVADTGIGIPDDELPHIFERFYRVDKARSRALGGSGLGLAITKWVVEAHGGKITVASKVGVGTTFAVSLPRQ
jgi:two-component system, OmpR family, sensor kinase